MKGQNIEEKTKITTMEGKGKKTTENTVKTKINMKYTVSVAKLFGVFFFYL